MSNLKLVKFEEVTPTLLRVAYFDGHLAELISHLNLPIYGAYDGLDEMVFAFLTLPSGRTVTLGEYANSPRIGVDLYVDSKMDDIPAAIYESCQQVRIPKSQVVWFRDKFQAEIDHLFAERGSIQEIEKSNKNQEVIYSPISCFQHSLRIYERTEFSEYWAMLQYNLGSAYCEAFNSGVDNQSNNLKLAIDSYGKSLEVYNLDEFPERWEIGQKSLLEAKNLLVKHIGNSNHEISEVKTFLYKYRPIGDKPAKQRSFFSFVILPVSNFIFSVKLLSSTVTTLLGTITNAIGKLERDNIAVIMYHDDYSKKNVTEQEVNFISIKLGGKGTDFLEFFVESIDTDTLYIDISKLQQHPDPTFKTGFSILLNELRSPKRRWCIQENGNFILSESHRDFFYRWISEEILVQAMHEKSLENQTTFNQPTRNIHFGIPYST